MNDKSICLSIDRIEEDKAVCIADSGETFIIPVSSVSGEISEGKILVESENGLYSVDENETERRRKAVFELSESLFDE
ncbi:MAG: DUF3006 domain-containing protein [Acutalibacteraceae bacterium]